MKFKYSLIFSMVMSLVISGCAMFIHDDEIDDVKMQSANITDFEGYYLNPAQYWSVGSFGSEMERNMVFYIGPPPYHSGNIDYIKIAYLKGELTFKGFNKESLTFSRTLKEGVDFVHENGGLMFNHGGLEIGSVGNPGIGLGAFKSYWFINTNKNLTITTKGGAIGLLCVIPVVGGGEGMVIFRKIDDQTLINKLNGQIKSGNCIQNG